MLLDCFVCLVFWPRDGSERLNLTESAGKVKPGGLGIMFLVNTSEIYRTAFPLPPQRDPKGTIPKRSQHDPKMAPQGPQHDPKIILK